MAGNEERSGSSLKKQSPSEVRVARASDVNKLEVIHVENHSTNVIPFKFDKRELRTLLVGDQPWFVATDVALALEYAEAKDMTRNLDEDEKGRQIVPTLGGDQEMLVINESGLYSAILRSRKAEAKRFKKWVTAEVLPAIRKHGRYEDEQGKMATLVGQTIGTDGFHVLGALVAGKVRALPKPVQRRATMKMWAQVHAAFNVRSAEDIPAAQLDSARNFIAAYALEGEWIPAIEKEEGGITLDRLEVQHLYLLLSGFVQINKYKGDILHAARAFRSEGFFEIFDVLHDGGASFQALDKRRKEIYGEYRALGLRGGYAEKGAAA